MRNKTTNILLESGMPANVKGFKYIVDAMCLYDQDDYCSGKTMVLYHTLGKKYDSSENSIERNIRYAFKKMFEDGNKDVIDKYFGKVSNYGNSNLLHTLYLRIKLEEQGGKLNADYFSE